MSQEVLQFYIDFQNNCINLYIKSHYYSINTIIVYVINNATFYMDDVISPLHPPILPSLLGLLPARRAPLLERVSNILRGNGRVEMGSKVENP